MNTITGRDLLDAGFPQGPEFGNALTHVRGAGFDRSQLREWVTKNRPPERMKPQESVPYRFNIEAETLEEEDNVIKVRETMDALMRTPTVVSGAVMPDACPAGPVGTIPVGGVVTTRNAIHPGMHSADICCSVMATIFSNVEPAKILDAVHQATHFGPGGRPNGKRYTMSPALYDQFRGNAFLSDKKILQSSLEMMGTQGDGNHFAFVGSSEATGKTVLITHHGSRGPGAGLYKLGMRVAEKYRTKLSEGVLKGNAWIPADSEDGAAYWEALQLIRKWTKANHNCLHAATEQIARAESEDRFWNEHNFVFREGDLFHHAKGATPIVSDFMPDCSGTQIVPLNMASPVLFIRGKRNDRNLGFAPHGAGRNYSRSQHKRLMNGEADEAIFARETQGIDARFFCGVTDISELPSAYKPAYTVVGQMEKFNLADVVDRIHPFGCIMAGDWERNAPWRTERERNRKC